MRRRWLLVGAALAAIAGLVVAGVLLHRSSHGNPDPDGRILAGLRTVEFAVPAGAHVMLRQANEPLWNSCDGRAGTVGWNDVTVSVQFRTTVSADALLAQADSALTHSGWQRAGDASSPLGPGARWTRAVADSTTATATLTPGTAGQGTYWDLAAVAPPVGQRASGC